MAREAPAGVPLEIIVVLNAAEPTLREALDREIVGARVVATEVSLGFAGGANLGARQAHGELLHLLHDDTEVCAGWLESLIDALNNCPEAGAAGSLILNEDGTVQSAGAVLWRNGVTTPPWTESPPDAAFFGFDPFPVDYCASASLLIRRELWDAAGGLDEELYPAYYIDVDLALAVRSQGRTVGVRAAISSTARAGWQQPDWVPSLRERAQPRSNRRQVGRGPRASGALRVGGQGSRAGEASHSPNGRVSSPTPCCGPARRRIPRPGPGAGGAIVAEAACSAAGHFREGRVHR